MSRELSLDERRLAAYLSEVELACAAAEYLERHAAGVHDRQDELEVALTRARRARRNLHAAERRAEKRSAK